MSRLPELPARPRLSRAEVETLIRINYEFRQGLDHPDDLHGNMAAIDKALDWWRERKDEP